MRYERFALGICSDYVVAGHLPPRRTPRCKRKGLVMLELHSALVATQVRLLLLRNDSLRRSWVPVSSRAA